MHRCRFCLLNFNSHAQHALVCLPYRNHTVERERAASEDTVTAVFVVETISDAFSIPDATPDTSSSFDGFGGGDSGGGGASDSF